MSVAATLIKKARTDADLTQVELAQRMGTTQSVVARLESRRSNPRIDTLQRAIAATGSSLNFALGPDFGIDESLIASNLHFEPSERLRRFASFYASARKLREAQAESSGP